tara:strand:+ start:2154 stop:2399 length:246 start_codon:yes stop_codon:yes gene_type:complete
MNWKDILKGEFEQWRGAQNQPPADIDNVNAPYNAQAKRRIKMKLMRKLKELKQQLSQDPNNTTLQQQVADAQKEYDTQPIR